MILSNYSRIFSALLPKGIQEHRLNTNYISHIAIFILSIITVVLGYLFLVSYTEYKQISNERLKEEESLAYWEKIVKAHPAYPAAYFEAAVYSAKTNEGEKAIVYLQQALLVDPNFTEAQNFLDKLSKD